MKNECELVQDLLIGYSDNTLHEQSKKIVENHIKHCNNCQNLLSDLRQDTIIENNDKELDYLKKFNKKINTKKIIISILLILLILLIIFSLTISLSPTYIKVYLNDNITQEEIYTIKNKLENEYKVKVTYTSKEEELEKMEKNIKGNSNILDGYENNNILPASFTIEIHKSKIEEIFQYLRKQKNIDHIYQTQNISISK